MHVDSYHPPDTYRALIVAANGEGALVVTDRLEVDAATGAPIVGEYSDADPLEMEYGAIDILLDMYQASGAVAIATLALAKGMHSMCTFVAYTDEGWYFRDVLRCGRYERPYRMVMGDRVQASRFCIIVPGDKTWEQGFIDGTCTETAASVALSEPMTGHAGGKLPTLVRIGPLAAAGEAATKMFAQEKQHMRSSVLEVSARFSHKYVDVLRGLFEVWFGELEMAMSALQTTFHFAILPRAANRHCYYRVMALFYWTTPTSLLAKKEWSIVTMNGCGLLVGTMKSVKIPAFPDGTCLAHGPQHEAVLFMHRSCCTTPFILHHYMNAYDDLDNIKLWG